MPKADPREALRDLEKQGEDYIWRVARAAGAEIDRLRAENFKLAAGVCEYRGGDDRGNPFCLKTKTPI